MFYTLEFINPSFSISSFPKNPVSLRWWCQRLASCCCQFRDLISNCNGNGLAKAASIHRHEHHFRAVLRVGEYLEANSTFHWLDLKPSKETEITEKIIWTGLGLEGTDLFEKVKRSSGLGNVWCYMRSGSGWLEEGDFAFCFYTYF